MNDNMKYYDITQAVSLRFSIYRVTAYGRIFICAYDEECDARLFVYYANKYINENDDSYITHKIENIIQQWLTEYDMKNNPINCETMISLFRLEN